VDMEILFTNSIMEAKIMDTCMWLFAAVVKVRVFI